MNHNSWLRSLCPQINFTFNGMIVFIMSFISYCEKINGKPYNVRTKHEKLAGLESIQKYSVFEFQLLRKFFRSFSFYIGVDDKSIWGPFASPPPGIVVIRKAPLMAETEILGFDGSEQCEAFSVACLWPESAEFQSSPQSDSLQWLHPSVVPHRVLFRVDIHLET